MKLTFLFLALFAFTVEAHVPVLLLPIKGTPIASHYLGNSAVSRAVYAELTTESDLFVVQWLVKDSGEEALLQLFTPSCAGLPQYESFQPEALLLRGEAPWKVQGESHGAYVARLASRAVGQIGSSYSLGKRPVYEEPNAKQTLWVGGEWRGKLKAGLYSLVVHANRSGKGNFVLGLNEKEAWTRDLQKYVAEILPSINARLCSPAGFSGKVKWAGR